MLTHTLSHTAALNTEVVSFCHLFTAAASYVQAITVAKCIQWPVKQRVEFDVLLLPSFIEAVVSLTAHMQQ